MFFYVYSVIYEHEIWRVRQRSKQGHPTIDALRAPGECSVTQPGINEDN